MTRRPPPAKATITRSTRWLLGALLGVLALEGLLWALRWSASLLTP